MAASSARPAKSAARRARRHITMTIHVPSMSAGYAEIIMNSITTLQRRRPLFDIVNDLLNHITASDGVVTETIDALELELQDKTEAYAAVIRQLETEAAGLDDLAHAYKLKAAKRADAAGALKDRLAVALQRAGVDRIEAPTARAF